MPARWSSDSPTPSEESNPWLSRKIALGAWDSTITTALKKEQKESKAHALAVEAYNSGGYDAGQLPAPAWATIRLALKAYNRAAVRQSEIYAAILLFTDAVRVM